MTEANRKIVEFIRDEWVIPLNNNSKFAVDHNIDEKTVRRIRDDETYQKRPGSCNPGFHFSM